jgi:hypothetical protein
VAFLEAEDKFGATIPIRPQGRSFFAIGMLEDVKQMIFCQRAICNRKNSRQDAL